MASTFPLESGGHPAYMKLTLNHPRIPKLEKALFLTLFSKIEPFYRHNCITVTLSALYLQRSLSALDQECSVCECFIHGLWNAASWHAIFQGTALNFPHRLFLTGLAKPADRCRRSNWAVLWTKTNGNYDPGEPAVSYRWTGWVWEITTGWGSRLQENYQSF